MFVKRGTNIHFLKRYPGVNIVCFFLTCTQQKLCLQTGTQLPEDLEAIIIPGFPLSIIKGQEEAELVRPTT